MDQDHKFVLDQQVQELHDYRAAERNLAIEEAALMREQWDMERQEAAKVEGLRREVLDAAQDELHQFNKHKRNQLAASVASEREDDLARLTAQVWARAAHARAERRRADAHAERRRAHPRAPAHRLGRAGVRVCALRARLP
eukprot:1644332-Prymnesium_polylepis.1